MTTDRYQRGLDRMMELVSTEHTNTFDHAKLVESYQSLDEDLSDYIVSFAFGDIYSRDRPDAAGADDGDHLHAGGPGHRAPAEAAH